jgi:hypothetical protein
MKVIKVIDHYMLEIDKGTEDGIAPGHQFELYKIDEHSSEINKGIGEIVEVKKNSALLKSIQQKVGGKKSIIKTGSGEAFTEYSDAQDLTQNVESGAPSVPFSNPSIGDLVKPHLRN